MPADHHPLSSTVKGPGFLAWAALASVLFPLFFITQGIGRFDFWWCMSANITIFLSWSFILDPAYTRFLIDDFRNGFGYKFAVGIASAAVLYGVFWLGNLISPYIIPGARDGINGVYQFKSSASTIRIFWSMVLLIGPGEELIWRGFLQRHLESRVGRLNGFLVAAAFYTGIHIFSGNIMLTGAALVCGLFWGFLYYRYRSMVINTISHTIWDVAVFLLFPFH